MEWMIPGAAVAGLDLPWVRALRECRQDQVFHAEGDAWTHTLLVLEALQQDPTYRDGSPATRRLLWLAGLLHDVGKPAATRTEEGRVTSPHHAQVGEIEARRILWEAGVPFVEREAVCGLVRFHQVPFHFGRELQPHRMIEVSLRTRNDLLVALCRADTRGRRASEGEDQALEAVELYRLAAEELGILAVPFPFATDHARVVFFEGVRAHLADPARPWPALHHAAFDDTVCEAVVMAGLPGSGKDTWIRRNLPDWPMIALDDLREELDAPAGQRESGAVVQLARERVREQLRRREPFIWNATNLSRELRGRTLRLIRDYRGRTRIVYLETTPQRLHLQNSSRAAVVPRSALERMLRRWQVPDLTEAHRVDWLVTDEQP